MKTTLAKTTVVLGLLLSVPAFAAENPDDFVPPPETKGDPAPDTATAQGFLQRGRYDDAIRQAKLALGRDEKHVPAMLVMARSYYYLRKYEYATSIVDLAKTIDPNCAECYDLLGWLALVKEDRASAAASFKKATELKDDYGAAWNNLAAQLLYAKNYDSAIPAAEKATHLMPRFAKAQLNLGSAYRGKGRHQEAEAAYKKALDIDAGLADAYFNLGILYLDARDMQGVDLPARMNTAISYLNRYKQVAASRLQANDPADGYITEARSAIDKEVKRLERLKKQQERNKPKTGDK
jgi:tetratricopeptide (TPR) repeat protein